MFLLSKMIGSRLFFVAFIFLTGCTALPLTGVPLENYPAAIYKINLPVGFKMPYGLMYSQVDDEMAHFFNRTTLKASYQRGIIATPWLAYKIGSLFTGRHLYRYRVIEYITKYGDGYGIHVRAPIEERRGGKWVYDSRDKKIEQRAWQDTINWINTRNLSAERLWAKKKYIKNPPVIGLK